MAGGVPTKDAVMLISPALGASFAPLALKFVQSVTFTFSSFLTGILS